VTLPHDFFKREHLIQAAWALLLAAIGFIGGTLVDFFKNPQEVIVKNLRPTTDTVVVHMGEAFRRSDSMLVSRLDSLYRLLELAQAEEVALHGIARVLPGPCLDRGPMLPIPSQIRLSWSRSYLPRTWQDTPKVLWPRMLAAFAVPGASGKAE
jgi:hypothetical protein